MIKEPLTFLFIGRSGSGKSTQAKLLEGYLEKNDSRPLLNIYAGGKMRELAKSDSLTSKLANEVMLAGGKQPDFLAVWAWSQELVEKLKKDMHLIIDGSPRENYEARILDEAFEFYDRKKVIPVLLDVSHGGSAQRLKGRGRFDDTEERIKNRLEYFEKYVSPAIEYYKKESKNRLVQVDGEQDIEDVQKEIIEKIFNDND